MSANPALPVFSMNSAMYSFSSLDARDIAAKKTMLPLRGSSILPDNISPIVLPNFAQSSNVGIRQCSLFIISTIMFQYIKKNNAIMYNKV